MVGRQEENVIVCKSKNFALAIINAYKQIVLTHHEYVLSRQFLKSGTSIGANVKEAIRAQTKADFGAKMNISLKEASETEYWLELLQESGYIDEEAGFKLLTQCRELIKILTSIVKTTFTT